MRPIVVAQLDRARPVLVVTREAVRPHVTRVSVAPITTTVRGLPTGVPVGQVDGLDHDCVVSCDDILTVPTSTLGRRIGHLLPAQEAAPAAAVRAAFDLASVARDGPPSVW